MTDIDIVAADHLLMTTKQVRKRMDFSRPVPRQLILDCIEVASRAPMGGNLERNRWMVIDDKEVMAKIAPFYQSVGRSYLAASQGGEVKDRQRKVIDSAMYLVDHIADAPAWVIAMRLDRLPTNASNSSISGYQGSVIPGVWSFQLAARARGLGSAWTTFHLEHEHEVAEILGIPESVTQVALLPVGYYIGDDFSPTPRRAAKEITFFNHWKQTID